MLEIPTREYLVMNAGSSYPFSDAPNLDDIATRVYGMTYVGQQTEDCLARGTYLFDLTEESDWHLIYQDDFAHNVS